MLVSAGLTVKMKGGRGGLCRAGGKDEKWTWFCVCRADGNDEKWTRPLFIFTVGPAHQSPSTFHLYLGPAYCCTLWLHS